MFSRLLIATLLLSVAAVVLSQRYYVAGGFTRLNRFSRPGYTCFDSAKLEWRKNTAAQKTGLSAFPVRVLLNSDEGFYFSDGQLFYFTGTAQVPVFEGKGVFKLQDNTTLPVVQGAVSNLFLNKDQTRLWLVGNFNRIGSTTINSKGQNQSGTQRIVALDISTSKTNPTIVQVPTVDSTIVSFDWSKAWPQRNTMLVIVTSHTVVSNARLWRVDLGAGWTALTDANQAAGTAIFKYAADESLWAYSDFDLLHQPIPSTNVRSAIQRLDPGATTFVHMVSTAVPQTVPTETISSTLWAPTGNKEVFYTFVNSVGSFNSPKDVNDTATQLNQYIYRIKEGGVRAIANNEGRLASAANVAAGSFPSMSSLLTDMVWDDVNQALVVLGQTIRYTVNGAYQSKIPDTVTGRITEDRTKYQAKRLTPGIVWLKGDAKVFSNAYAGGFEEASIPTSLAGLGINLLPKDTCFVTNVPVYDVFSPFTAMWENNKWQQIPGVTAGIEEDTVFGTSIFIASIERTSTWSNDAFFAGAFRTVGGVAVNSIFYYNQSRIEPLGPADSPGVTVYSQLGDPSGGSSPDDSDFSRYYGLRHGTVSRMVFDQSSKILYVAGSFYRAGSLYVRNIARWNTITKTWLDMDGGLSQTPSKIFMHGGNLYAFGTFTFAGSTHVVNFAMFNTRTERWEALARGVNSITDAVSYNGLIYVSVGAGTAVSGSTVHNGLFVWSQSSNIWTPIKIRRTNDEAESNNCKMVNSCTVANYVFYIIGNSLFVRSSTNILYILKGDAVVPYQTVFTGSTGHALLNGIKSGTKVNVITFGLGGTRLETDSIDGTPMWNYTPERQDLFTDSFITVFSATSKMNISVMALFISLALFFMFALIQ